MVKFKREFNFTLNIPGYKYELQGHSFEILANRYGVRIKGETPVVDTEEDLQVLAEMIGAAWTDHKALIEQQLHDNSLM